MASLNPLVSVVIPVYNGAALIQQAVESVQAQTYPEWELILVDDGSADNSHQVLLDYAASDNRIKALTKTNGGVADARNVGIAHASGSLIAFCDQDDYWMPAKLAAQVALFADQEVVLGYCGVVAERPNKRGQPHREQPLDTMLEGRVFDELLLNNFIGSCSAIFRKDAVEQVGMLEPDRRLMGVDDWHLWIMLANIGKVSAVKEYLSVHIVHGENYSLDPANMHSAELFCVEDLATKMPSVIDLPRKRKLLAITNRRYAGEYLFFGHFKKASQAYFAAFQTERHDLRSLFIGAALAVLPNAILSQLQARKRSAVAG